MSEESTESAEFDVDAIAALARPSNAPPPPSATEDLEGDGTLDLAALRESIRPSAAAEVDDDDDDEVEDEAKAETKAASEPPPAKDEADPFAAADARASEPPEPRASTPAPAPEREEKRGGNTWVGVVIGFAAAAALMYFMRPGPSEEGTIARTERPHETASAPRASEMRAQPATMAAPAAAATTVAEPETTEPEASESEATEPEATEPSTTEPNTAEPNTAEPSTTEPATRGTRRGGARGSSPAVAAEATMEAAPATTEMAAAPTMAATMSDDAVAAVIAGSMAPGSASMMSESSGMRSIDDLLSGAGISGAAMAAAAPAMMAEAAPAMEDLPDTPSRAVTTRVLAGLMPRMRQCAGDQVGVAVARLRVANDGSVRSANVGGRPFGGTPQGACMERALRGARFPRFQRPTFDLTYPFSIRPL